ncbi:MAG TPA: hypothetical protein DET40_19810 [Lentisphaeria bacterium]|nr:MAG: hypothetical protein A2X45_11075 [Lentisphaerae bacterium GWF2_50_93]HCE45796.1 hypothetical protein [Lentisphaeria bacterium]
MNESHGRKRNGNRKSGKSPVEIYSFPLPAPDDVKVEVNGAKVRPCQMKNADFCAFSASSGYEVLVEINEPIRKAHVRPLKRGIKPVIKGKILSFKAKGAGDLVIDIPGRKPLFLYVSAPDTDIPSPRDPKVKYFKAGKIHEAGEIVLHDNETLYIEGGAVVRGCVRALKSKNVKIRGHGIIDACNYPKGERRTIVFDQCVDSSIEGIISINPASWMTVLGACERITVRGLREIGDVLSSDGIDICGCRDILVEDCTFMCNDDGVVIKSLNLKNPLDSLNDWSRDVENIITRRCIFLQQSGAAMEIGHELRTKMVRNIRFEDCDIVAIHGFGSAFSIRNADRALVKDVYYENIRVEHHYYRLVDIRVLKSMWSKDEERGYVENIFFKNIQAALTIYNPGYSFSLVSGFDPDHKVRNVVFEDFFVDGKKVSSVHELDLYTRDAEDIAFR